MAGLGAKLFPAFSKLTSSDVNGYLADQVIMRFANATARNAAFGQVGEPTLAEGMTCYLDDTNVLQSYNGTAWVSIASSNGAVLQVISSPIVTNNSVSNAPTFIDATNLNLSITPTSTTSKVFVIVQSNYFNSGGVAENGMWVQLVRGTTVISSPHTRLGYTGTLLVQSGQFSVFYLDSPATTSSVNYKIQFRNNTNGNNVQINAASATSTMMLMEISA